MKLLVSLGLLLFTSAQAWALQSSCMCPRQTTRERLQDVDIAVSGRLTDALWLDREKAGYPANSTVYSLKIATVLKGEETDKIRIVLPLQNRACSLNLQVGQVRQLLLVKKEGAKYYTAPYCANQVTLQTDTFWEENEQPVDAVE